MKLIDIQHGASGNLTQTYFNLGLAIPNTTLVKEKGFQACLGEFEHPICNFAAGLKLDPWSTNQLVELASQKRAFNVYALPGDEPEHVGELLYRSEFRVSYRLAQMVAEPKTSDCIPLLKKAESKDVRLQISQFMTEQFFPRQTEGFRKRVAQATADATELDLYELVDSKQRIAALMLCHTAEMIGLYNLCVAAPKRGFGVGKSLTQWVLTVANEQNKLITLQCDSRLQGWYEEQGFCRIGTVDVYTLSKTHRGDIMNGT